MFRLNNLNGCMEYGTACMEWGNGCMEYGIVVLLLHAESEMDVAALGLCETAISSTLKAFFKLLPHPLIPNGISTKVLDTSGEITHTLIIAVMTCSAWFQSLVSS